MTTLEIGEYEVRVDIEKRKIELQNGTYKYINLNFDEFKELCIKVGRLIKK